MLVIILAFVPVFLLTGQEGKLFHPLAFTKTFAMIGATLLAVTAVPVFGTLLVRGPFKPSPRTRDAGPAAHLRPGAGLGAEAPQDGAGAGGGRCSPSAW